MAGTAQGGAARSDSPKAETAVASSGGVDQTAQSKFPIPEAAALTLLGSRSQIAGALRDGMHSYAQLVDL